MANPLLHFDDILDDVTPTVTSAAAGFPITNIHDWRMGTSYRWKATSSADQDIDIDLGGSTKDADTIAIGGHNLSTVSGTVQVLADTFTPPTTSRLAAFAPSDDLPVLRTFTAPGVLRYWRIKLSGAMSAAAQIAIITLGVRLDFEAGALPDLDPYQRSSVAEPFINNNGSPIGVNVRSKNKRFVFNYGGGDPGMTRADFFRKSGINFEQNFLDHSVDSALPVWFAWNITQDANDVFLCRVVGPTVSMPFVGSINRQGLQMTLIPHREIS